MKYKKYIFILFITITLIFVFKNKFKVELNQNSNLDKSVVYNEYLKKDTLVILNQWASWCSPCVEEIPYLNSLKKKYGNKVKFISFSKDRDTLKTKYSMTKNYFSWQELTLIDNNNKDAVDVFLNKKSLININVLPKTFLIKNGEILQIVEGKIEDTKSFEKAIRDNM